MRHSILYVCCAVFLCIFAPQSFAEAGTGMPLKYISSCEIDLTDDDKTDIVFLVETIRGRELIVLIKTEKGYDAQLISTGKPNMHLSCHFGESIKETSAGGKKGRVHNTGGTYIKLTQPESSSVVYFWNNKTFQEVWTSD